jgi:hypothetical protein
MSELSTPYDKLTGMPLPIFVTPRVLDDAGEYVDFHHHFHPKNHISLGFITSNDPERPSKGKDYSDMNEEEKVLWLEGKAVRNSRVQIVPEYLHGRYHDLLAGSPLPQTRAEKFTAAVLACAGVMPRRAIDLSKKGDYQEVDLTDRQHRFLAGSKRLHFAGAHEGGEFEAIRRDRIGRFFAEYAIERSAQDLIDDSLIDEFLHSTDTTARKKLGRSILEMAIDDSVASLIPIHEEAGKEGMLRRRRTHLSNVVTRFFIPSKFADYQRPLEHALKTSSGLA